MLCPILLSSLVIPGHLPASSAFINNLIFFIKPSIPSWRFFFILSDRLNHKVVRLIVILCMGHPHLHFPFPVCLHIVCVVCVLMYVCWPPSLHPFPTEGLGLLSTPCSELWTRTCRVVSWPLNSVYWLGIEWVPMDKHVCRIWPVRGQGGLEDWGQSFNCCLLLTIDTGNLKRKPTEDLLHQVVSPGATRSPTRHWRKLPDTFSGCGPPSSFM